VIRVSAGRNAGNRERALIVRQGEVRRIDRHDVGGHIRMNIAEQARETWLIENGPLDHPFGIHAEIEFLAIAEGEDVVKNLVVVWKFDGRADANHQHVWHEREVSLIEHDFLRRIRRRTAGGEPDNGVLSRTARRLYGSRQFGSENGSCRQENNGEEPETPHGSFIGRNCAEIQTWGRMARRGGWGAWGS
jgi:hypothetical protein